MYCHPGKRVRNRSPSERVGTEGAEVVGAEVVEREGAEVMNEVVGREDAEVVGEEKVKREDAEVVGAEGEGAEVMERFYPQIKRR